MARFDSEEVNYDEKTKRIVESTGQFQYRDTLHRKQDSMVVKVYDQEHAQLRALKLLEKYDGNIKRAETECLIWRELTRCELDTTHITQVTAKRPLDFGDYIAIPMELADNSLYRLISNWSRNGEAVDESEAVMIVTHAANGTHNIHLTSYSHNDLKPSNILYFYNSGIPIFKVADCGCATLGHGESTTQKGTFGYMAPEVYTKRDYSPRSDLFSLSVVLFELLHPGFKQPFTLGGHGKEAFEEIKDAGHTRSKVDELRCDARLKEIICAGLSFDPDERGFANLADYLNALQGKTVVKPIFDQSNYEEFVSVHKQLMALMKRKTLYSDKKYGTASLENIDKIFNLYTRMQELEAIVRSQEGVETKGVLIQSLESSMQDARDRKGVEAEEHRKGLSSVIKSLTVSTPDARKLAMGVYERILCWGPPLSVDDAVRDIGNERYSLEEIQRGEHKAAIPSEILAFLEQ